MTMITICNYDKFQQSGRALSDQKADQKADQKQPTLPGLVDEFAPETLNQLNHRESIASLPEEAISVPRLTKPPHGSRSKDGKRRWFDYGTALWTQYAEDFKDAHGTEKFPENRFGGRGNWFVVLGETRRKSIR